MCLWRESGSSSLVFAPAASWRWYLITDATSVPGLRVTLGEGQGQGSNFRPPGGETDAPSGAAPRRKEFGNCSLDCLGLRVSRRPAPRTVRAKGWGLSRPH